MATRSRAGRAIAEMLRPRIGKWILAAILLPGIGGCVSSPTSTTHHTDHSVSGLPGFGRLIGDWRIEQEVLQADGSWQSVEDADWDFRYALGGHAVQDFWVQPSTATALQPGAVRQYGTNLRIYDPTTENWHIVWAASDQTEFAVYTASETSAGDLVMTGDDPDRPGVIQRITYTDIQLDSWRWTMAFSRDGKKWLEVARIRASRR